MRRSTPDTRKADNESRSRPTQSTTVEHSRQLRELSSGVPSTSAGNWAIDRALKGVPLDPGVRSDMEARFGADFDDVRIHDGPQANELAASADAKAYTVGNDVVFSAGRFDTKTNEGRHLLAHELAHVVQQSRSARADAQPAQAGALESAAESAADSAMGGGPVAVAGASAVGMACSPEDERAGATVRVIEDHAAGKVRVVRVDQKGAIVSGLAELTPPVGTKPDAHQVTVGFDVSESGQHGQQRVTVPPDWQSATNPKDPVAVHLADMQFEADAVMSVEGEQLASRRGEVQAFFEERPWLDYTNMFAWPNASGKADIDAVYEREDFKAWKQLRETKAHQQESQRQSSAYQQQIYQQSGMLLPLDEAREVWERHNAQPQTEWEKEKSASPGGLPNEIRDPDNGELLGYRTLTFADKYTWVSGVGIATYSVLDRDGKVVGTPREVTVLSPDADAVQSIARGAPISGDIINLIEADQGLSLDLRDLGRKLSEGERLDRAISLAPFGDTARAAMEAGTGVSMSGKDLDPLLNGGEARILTERERLGKAGLAVAGGAAEVVGLNIRMKARGPKTNVTIEPLRPKVHADAPKPGARRMAAPSIAPSVNAPNVDSSKLKARAGAPDVATPRVRPSADAKQRNQAGRAPAKPLDTPATAPSNKAAPPVTDKGLADRGVRPAPGERNQTRAQKKAERSAERWEKSVDDWAERAFADPAESVRVPRVRGNAGPRIEGRRVPGRPPARSDMGDIPLRPGETSPQALARVRTVIGKTVADYPALTALWNDARASVLRSGPLTADNYGRMYDLTRNAFWRRVRSNTAQAAQARALLDSAGFELPAQRSRAPQLAGVDRRFRDAERSISLDHIEEKGQGSGWRKALDADNLRLEFAMPNTHREIIQMRHPEMRPGHTSAGVQHFPQGRVRPERPGPASARSSTPDEGIRDDALIDAILDGRLQDFLDQDDLIEAALRGNLRQVLDAADVVADMGSQSGYRIAPPKTRIADPADDIDPKVREALHDLLATDEALADEAIEVLKLHLKHPE